jgi:predicted negative regulator of RcsB-dependent stress response
MARKPVKVFLAEFVKSYGATLTALQSQDQSTTNALAALQNQIDSLKNSVTNLVTPEQLAEVTAAANNTNAALSTLSAQSDNLKAILDAQVALNEAQQAEISELQADTDLS